MYAHDIFDCQQLRTNSVYTLVHQGKHIYGHYAGLSAIRLDILIINEGSCTAGITRYIYVHIIHDD
jgi:hypothetical protein